MEIVIGIDLGTQGVRILAVDNKGSIVASSAERLEPNTTSLPSGWVEQDPVSWWNAAVHCLKQLTAALPIHTQIVGIAVDSTSGTVLPVDADGNPLHHALMYNDSRSESLVAEVQSHAGELERSLGYAFNASFALPKIIWLQRSDPEMAAVTKYYIHAADFITGRLTDNYAQTDTSNALKTGYDLLNDRWPSFIEHSLGLAIDKLPQVTMPGHLIGHVSRSAAESTGLAAGIPVFAGATDGTAAQIASGAVEPGAWNSSLGTTLVIKGITRQLLIDPQNRIYSHRHPNGWWMPGGASNTGCEWIVREYPGANLARMDAAAATITPTRLIRYPLARLGERFPFVNTQATGFLFSPTGAAPNVGDINHYTAGLEGAAMHERLAYEMLTEIGAVIGDRIYSTGGGSKSNVWLSMRASMLNRQLVRLATSETAMGAALLAATGAWYMNLVDASRAMVHPDIVVDPKPEWVRPYHEMFAIYVDQLRLRGYWH